ncbi:MAG TPA: GNAT family N-acetyltransferase [Thermomicrobiales bacterium]
MVGIEIGIEIETARLRLRPMRAEDADALLRVFADPRVMAAFAVAPFDRAQMERWVRRNLEHQERYGYGLFSVIDKADGQLIGNCGLEQMTIEGVTAAELGYDLRSDYWHRGLATEAAAAVRDYAFRALALPQLVSLIRCGNARSCRVAEKIGMHRAMETTRDGQRYWLSTLMREEAARTTAP